MRTTSRSSVFSVALLVGLVGSTVFAQPPTNAGKPSARPAASPRPVVAPVPTASPAATPTRQVVGIVLDPQGRPVKNALVYTGPPPLSVPLMRSGTASGWRPSDARFTLTGEDGRFVLESARAPLSVRAEFENLEPAEIENVRLGVPLTLRLSVGLNRRGLVLSAITGGPIAGVEVVATELGLRMPAGADRAGRSRAVSDKEGRFVIRGLKARSHLLSVDSKTLILAASETPFVPGAGESVLLVRPGVLLSGVVKDGGEHGVSGATLALSRAFGGPGATGRTDQQGAFAFAIPPGRYTLSVTHPDFAPLSREGLEAAGPIEPLEIRMYAGAMVRGRIVSEKGEPIAGEVRTRLFGRPRPLFTPRPPGDVSTPKGGFSLPGIPPGDHELDLAAKGFTALSIPFKVKAADKSIDLGEIAMEHGLQISGRVIDESGEPVPRARVTVSASRNVTISEAFEDETDEKGRFAIAGVKEGRYLLAVSADGYSPVGNARASSGARDVIVVLRRPGRIHVRVTRSGPGVSNRAVTEPVTLVARPVDPLSNPFVTRAEEVPNQAGEVTFSDLWAGRQSVEIGVAGLARKDLGLMTIEAGAVTELGEVQLDLGLAVRGVVLDSRGNPVPGARIEASLQGSNRPFAPRSHSDAQGRFQITGLPTGPVEIFASHPGFATTRAWTTVDTQGTAPEMEVVLQTGGRIAGTLKRRNGNPVAGAFVSYGALFGDVDPRSRTETDAGGGFSFENVVPGQVTVSVLQGLGGPFETALSAKVAVQEDETASIALVLREIVVRGRVEGAAARANLRVRLSSLTSGGVAFGAGTASISLPSNIPRGMALTGSDGAYELMVDQPGGFFAEVTSYDGSQRLLRRQVDVPDLDVFPLDLSLANSRLNVTVLDANTETPIADAVVQARPNPKDSVPLDIAARLTGGTATTGADGRAALFLEAGDYSVTAVATGHVPGTIAANVEADTEIEMPLESGLKISGSVRTIMGASPPGYYVAAGPVGGGEVRRARPLGGGMFEIDGLRPGRYRLSASAADDFGEGEADAGTDGVEIVVRPGGTVSVFVVDSSNRPVAGAAIRFSNGAGEPLSDVVYFAAEDGHLTMPAPAGRVLISASGNTLVGSATVTINPGETTVARVFLTEPPRK